MALLFTDVEGSVSLKTRLGTTAYAGLIGRHDAIFRSIVHDCPGADIIKDLGDGFLTRFASTSDAVDVALRFQHALAAEPWTPEPIRVRIGLHLGEVAELAEDAGGAPKLVGLAADISARIMGLARAGQILMTRAGFDDARQYVREHPPVAGPPPDLRWMAHGPYLFHGADEPMEVFEVGAVGIAPLSSPPDSEKARRAVPAGEEDIYGWRPALALTVPRLDHWALTRKLGEGGFGEIWLATNNRTGDRRVFKFCFDADRVRSFKRELTLFRILRETLGDRPDIARIHDIQFDRPPFYLESEYTELGDLDTWAQSQGGFDRLPLATRLDLMARICDAVSAAHSVGVLHKDLKPSNILVYEQDGEPRPRLADFGIGGVVDPARLQGHEITMTGLTATIADPVDSSRTGTRIYSPPESLVGKPFTIQGDVYALGVILYQFVVGDLRSPLAHGWEAFVPDPLLRDDIARCVAGRPEDRLPSAASLAKRLRSLAERRKSLGRRRIARVAVVSTIVLAALLALTSAFAFRERTHRRRIADERDMTAAVNDFLNDDLLRAIDPEVGPDPLVTVREVLDRASVAINERLDDQPLVKASIRHTLGRTYLSLGELEAARPHLQAALDLRRAGLDEDAPALLEAVNSIGVLCYEEGRYEEAEEIFTKVLATRERTLGPNDVETLVSMNNLGALYRLQNKLDEAIDLQQRNLRIILTSLGPEDRHTLTVMANLAVLYTQQTRYDEAEAMYKDVLDIRRRVLGERHPHTLTTLNTLGNMYYRLGDYDSAEPLLVEALAGRTAALSRTHPATLRTMSNLGELHRRRKEFDRAEPLLREALNGSRLSLPAGHPSIASAISGLALLYSDRGDDESAMPLLVEVLEIRRRTLPPGSTSILNSMSNLAKLYTKLERYEDARPLFVATIADARRTLAEGHWYIGAYLYRYAECLIAMERRDEAEAALVEAHELIGGALGESNPRTIDVVRTLADLYDDWGRADAAARWRAKLAVAAEGDTGS